MLRIKAKLFTLALRQLLIRPLHPPVLWAPSYPWTSAPGLCSRVGVLLSGRLCASLLAVGPDFCPSAASLNPLALWFLLFFTCHVSPGRPCSHTLALQPICVSIYFCFYSPDFFLVFILCHSLHPPQPPSFPARFVCAITAEDISDGPKFTLSAHLVVVFCFF